MSFCHPALSQWGHCNHCISTQLFSVQLKIKQNENFIGSQNWKIWRSKCSNNVIGPFFACLRWGFSKLWARWPSVTPDTHTDSTWKPQWKVFPDKFYFAEVPGKPLIGSLWIECSSLDQSLLPQGCTLWFTSSCTHSVARSSLLTSGMYYSQCYLIRRKSGTPNRHKQQIHIIIILKCHLMEDNNLEQKLTKHRNTNSGIGVVFLLNNLCQYL